MSTSDWITIIVGIGGWAAAIIAFFSLIYQKRGVKQIKEKDVEQLTKEILYLALYYSMDPMRRVYMPNERTIELKKEWIAKVHQQVKQRLLQEV